MKAKPKLAVATSGAFRGACVRILRNHGSHAWCELVADSNGVVAGTRFSYPTDSLRTLSVFRGLLTGVTTEPGVRPVGTRVEYPALDDVYAADHYEATDELRRRAELLYGPLVHVVIRFSGGPRRLTAPSAEVETVILNADDEEITP